MSVRPQPGTVHMHPSGLAFVVLTQEKRCGKYDSTGVEVLVLTSRSDSQSHFCWASGSVQLITRHSGYWANSRPFTSLDKEGKVSP